jgi:hypothetical protein
MHRVLKILSLSSFSILCVDPTLSRHQTHQAQRQYGFTLSYPPPDLFEPAMYDFTATGDLTISEGPSGISDVGMPMVPQDGERPPNDRQVD